MDFQNDHIKKCCPQSAPDPAWDLVAQGRKAAGSSLQLWPKPQKHYYIITLYNYIILLTALSALRYYNVPIIVKTVRTLSDGFSLNCC